jgi:hypothetical protein
MNGYCSIHGKIATIVTEKKTYGEIPKMNYSLIMNYTKPKVLQINSKNTPYLKVFDSLSKQYKSGLLIVESDTLSEPISDILCNSESWDANDVDIMICRTFASMTQDEMRKATFMRISADPDFDPMILQKLDSIFQEKVLSLMICQFFVNENYNNVNRYIEIQSKRLDEEGYKEYIDYHEMSKQLAYFVYFDVMANKILNVPRSVIYDFINKLAGDGVIPVSGETALQLAEMITLE